MSEVNTNQPTLTCFGCNQLKVGIMKLEFDNRCSGLCGECTVSINNKATKDESPKVRELNEKFIEVLKKYVKHYNFINHETFVSLCSSVYDGIK